MRKASFLLAIGAYVMVLGTFSAWAQGEPPNPLPSMRVIGTFTPSREAAKSETDMLLWPAETHMYLGKPRSKEWMEVMYQCFAYQIVRVNGKYLDVGKALAFEEAKSKAEKMYQWTSELTASEFPAACRGIGPAGQVQGSDGCRVAQVIDDRQVLIRFRGSMAPLRHVTGVDATNLVDGAGFNGTLVTIGPYSYETASGTRATIPSYTLYRPLTRDEFGEALGRGTQLVFYEAKIAKLGESEYQANLRKPRTVPKGVDWNRVKDPKAFIDQWHLRDSHLWDKRPTVTGIKFVEDLVP